eukprot:COSAG02_NODE_45847_length_353_cov_1.437008_1_plen_106_part_01
MAARSLATPRSPILIMFLLDKNTFADLRSLQSATAAAEAEAARGGSVSRRRRGGFIQAKRREGMQGAPVEDVVAVERLDTDGELDEEHPGLVLRHHLALLREAAQA